MSELTEYKLDLSKLDQTDPISELQFLDAIYQWQPKGAEMSADWDRFFCIGDAVSLEIDGSMYDFIIINKEGGRLSVRHGAR